MLTARGEPGQRRLSELPLHPLLAAAYPVVFLFATNAAEQVTLAPLWVPLGLALAGTAVVLLVLRLVTGDWHWGALLTTVLVAGFFGYGHAWVGLGGVLGSQWPLIVAWALLVGIALFAAWRLRGRARRMTPALNLVAALLLLMNSWGLTQAVVAHGTSDPVQPEASDLELDPGRGDAPDVYNIVLDRYAGSTGLAEAFDFDNEPFLTALEERGFRVARHAHANYIKTPLSLVSSLNMDYLDAEQLESEQESGRDRDPIHRLLRGRLVVPSALKELGYQYVHIANWWQPSATNIDADRVFRYSGQDEFSSCSRSDHPAPCLQRARGGALGSVRLAGAVQPHALRAGQARADPGTPRAEVRVRAPAHPARPLCLRHRRLVHGPRAGGGAGTRRELPATAPVRQHSDARDHRRDRRGGPRRGDLPPGR